MNTLDTGDGGPARNSFELNQSLNSLNGIEAQLFWFRGNEEDSTMAADVANGRTLMGPHPAPLPRVGPRRLPRVRDISWVIARADIVVVHGYYIPWVPIVARVARRAGVPYVVTPHGSISRFELRRSRLRKRFFDVLFASRVDRQLAAMVVGSEREQADVHELRPALRVLIGGVGAGTSHVKPHMPVLDNERVLFLVSISRITSKKRIDLAIDCLAELRRLGVQAFLTVAGSGDDNLVEALHRHAVEGGVEDLVEFIGHVDSETKGTLLASADVFLLPSEDENFGIGFAEALASGVPAVVSDRVAAAAAASRMSTSIVNTPTGSSLAAAVLPYRDITVWNRASRQAIVDADVTFSWRNVAARWASILRSVVDHRGDPAAPRDRAAS